MGKGKSTQEAARFVTLTYNWHYELTVVAAGIHCIHVKRKWGDVCRLELSQKLTCIQLWQIEVPGNWECQGHSFPIYTNFQYPWPITAPFVPEDNPTGCYRKHFTISPSWKGKRYGPFFTLDGQRCCKL